MQALRWKYTRKTREQILHEYRNQPLSIEFKKPKRFSFERRSPGLYWRFVK